MKIRSLNIKKILFVLALITLSCIIFYTRFTKLGISGLSGDELVTARAPLFRDTRCYIYAFIINNFARFISVFTKRAFLDEFLLRLPSAIAALVVIPFLISIGKRIKNEFTGLLLLGLFTFCAYLINYARDARFYSFYFLASVMVIWTVIPILNNDFKNKKQEYITYFLYAFSMIFCMGIHQGSYLFYALSNIYIGLYIVFRFISSFRNKNKFYLLIDVVLKFLIIALPLLTCIWHIYKISKGQMYNDPTANTPLLPMLSYENVRKVLIEFYGRYPYSGYLFLVTIIFSIFLPAFNKYRKISFYCSFVFWGSIIALHYLPQSVVKEPLREKYVLFLLTCDIVIISCGFSAIIDVILLLFDKFNIRFKFLEYIYVLFVLSFLIYLGFKTTPRILKMDTFAGCNVETRNAAYKLDEVGENDIIITLGSYHGLNHALDYESRRTNKRNIWKYYTDPYNYRTIKASKSPGYIWLVVGEILLDADDFLDTVYSDGHVTVYRSKIKITDDQQKIGAFVAEVLNTSCSQNNTIVNFVQSFNNIDLRLSLFNELTKDLPKTKLKLSENLLKNGDFYNGDFAWSKTINNDGILFTNINGKSVLTLSREPNDKNFGVFQNLNVVSGKFYRISVSVKNNKNHKARMLGAYVNIYDLNSKNSDIIRFYDNCYSMKTKFFRFKARSSTKLQIQLMTGYGNIPEKTIADIFEVSVKEEIGREKVDSSKTTSNLIKNGNFTNEFNSWRVINYSNNIHIETDTSNNFFASINNSNGKPAFISQNFCVISGLTYCVSLNVKNRNDLPNEGAYLILTGFNHQKDKEQYLFLNNLRNGWNHIQISIKSKRTGAASLKLNSGHNNKTGCVMFNNVNVQEFYPIE